MPRLTFRKHYLETGGAGRITTELTLYDQCIALHSGGNITGLIA